MNLKLVVAVCVLAATPAFGQADKGGPPPAPKPTQADFQRLVQTISGDKTKIQTYCDLAKLNEQMEQVEEKKDTRTLLALGKKADELAQKLGPDYLKLMEGLEQVDENSSEAKDFAAALESLDKQCK